MEYQAKSNEKYTPFLIVFKVLQVTLTNICKISHQIFYFLLFYVSFYISRYNFSQIIRTSFIVIWKKDSLKPPHPLNGQNPLSVTKVFCRCSLIVLFFRTRGSTVIPTNWCKTFEACTWTMSKFDKNLPICYNIAIRRYDNSENSSSLSCTD